MQTSLRAGQALVIRDWRSKLTDGLLTSAILVLTWLLVALLVRPIALIFGLPGLLVLVLGLLAVAMFSFQQSLAPRRPETTRAWYGIAGGFLAWAVVEVSSYMGVPVTANLAGTVLLIMVGMIIWLLWRSGLPVGAKFFSLSFLLDWSGHIFMSVQGRLANLSPVFQLTYHATGYLALLAVALMLGWIVFKTERRIQRISAALAVWFLVSLAIYVFRGALF